ncbi:hypothetical protein BH23ACT2_BH23ACT2_12090 [soil metagenome]
MADDPTDDPIDDSADATDAEVDAATAPSSAPVDEPEAAEDDPSPAAEAGTTPPVVRKKVVSKRVTPKGGGQGKGPVKGSTAARAHAPEGDDAGYSSRYTPPTAKYAPGPSPWWVPAIMFGLLIVGSAIIILNYAGVFGDADNIRLVIGLGFILGGIITATQLR